MSALKQRASEHWYLLGLAIIILWPPVGPWLDQGLYPKFFFLALLNIVALVQILLKNQKASIPRILSVYGLFVVLSIIGLFSTEHLGNGLLVLHRDFQIGITAWVLVSLGLKGNEKVIYEMLFVVLAALIIWGIAELIYAMDSPIITHQMTYEVSASLGHRNLYAQFIALIFPMAMLWLVDKSKLSLFAATFVVITTVLTLLSRGAWIVLGSSLALFVALFFGQAKRLSVRNWIIAGGLIATSFFVLFLMVDDVYTLQHQVETLGEFSAGSIKDRMLLLKRSSIMFFDHWLVGIGLGDWPVEVMRFDQTGMMTQSGEIYYQRAHNDFIQQFAETGLIAGLCYALFFAYGLVSSVSQYFHKRDVYSLGFLASWVSLVIIGLTNFPKERAEFGIFLAILIALQSQRSHRVQVSSQLMSVLFVVLSLASASLFGLRLVSEGNFANALLKRQMSDWMGYAEELDRVNHNILPFDHTSHPIDWHHGIAFAQLSEPDSARFEFEAARINNPFHPDIHNNLGVLKAKEGDLIGAMNHFQESVIRTPNYRDGRLNISMIHISQGNYDAALTEFLKSDPSRVDAKYENLGQSIAIYHLNRLSSVFPERKLMLTVVAMRNTPTWAFAVIHNAAKNNVSFEQQVLHDAFYYMLKNCNDSTCNEVQEWKEKYLPGVQLELDL